MIALAHLIAGAVVAKKIKNIWLSWFLSLASHFILDAIPHSEYSGFSFWRFILPFDFALGLFLIWWLIRKEEKNIKIKVFAGAILATLPDIFSFSYKLFFSFLSHLPLIGKTLSVFLQNFHTFHFWTHALRPPTIFIGITSQIAIIFLSFFWWFRF